MSLNKINGKKVEKKDETTYKEAPAIERDSEKNKGKDDDKTQRQIPKTKDKDKSTIRLMTSKVNVESRKIDEKVDQNEKEEIIIARPRTKSTIIRDVIEKHSSSLEEMMGNHFRLFFNRLKEKDISFVNKETAAPLHRFATRLRWLLKDDYEWHAQRQHAKRNRRAKKARQRYNDYQYLASVKHQKPVPFPYPQPLPSWYINKPRRERGENCWACGRSGVYTDDDSEEDENASLDDLDGAATALEEKLDLYDVLYK